jgi:hypothetical protein
MCFRSVAWTLLFSCFAAVAVAAPQINNVSQRGLKIGEATVLVFDGGELAPETRIVSSLPLKSQQVKPDATAGRVAIEVVVDESAQPGIYALRLASSGGISNPVLVGVDRLPQAPFADETTSLPVALSGALSGAEVKGTKFSGVKGQRIVIDVEAERLGAGFKPLLRLYDARGKQIAFGSPQPWMGGDSRLQATLPADGKYLVEVHDRVYRASAPGIFRLKIGELLTADRVHPAAVGQAAAKLTFLGGNLPAEAIADYNAAGQNPGDRPASWPSLQLISGPRPNVIVSDHPEVLETGAGGIQDIGAASVGISGVLAKAGEEDQYAVAVTAGQRLKIQMQARRLGSPVDGVLAIRNEQGAQLAGDDDVPGSQDPLVADFTVPANVTKIVLAVKDLLGRGGSEFNYRLVVHDLAKPDFNLSASADRILIPAGGTQVLQVAIDRQNYAGPVKLELAGLPANMQVQGLEIAPAAPLGLVTLSAPQGVSGAGLISIVGRGADAAASVVRTARGPAVPGSELAPYRREEIAWGVAAPLPISVSWTSPDSLAQGSTVPAAVQLSRAANTAGGIRLRLLTTQPAIKKTIKENNVDKQVDDLARMLRLETDIVVPADQANAEVKLFVPADLPVTPWDAVLVAELLSPDGKTVVATAYAPARRFTITAAPK